MTVRGHREPVKQWHRVPSIDYCCSGVHLYPSSSQVVVYGQIQYLALGYESNRTIQNPIFAVTLITLAGIVIMKSFETAKSCTFKAGID